MKEKPSLKINYIMNTVLSLTGIIFPIITFPYVSRVLSPVGIGKYSFAFSFVSYFTMLSQLGIPTYGIRLCAQVRDHKDKLSQTVFELMLINFITAIISYTIFFLLLFNIPRLADNKLLLMICSLNIFFSALGVEWLYRALEQFSYITIRSLILKIISLIALFIFVRQENDYIIYAAISIFSSVGSNVFNFYNLRKYISFSSIKKPDLKRHLSAILIFFAMSIATTVYTNLDNVMLGFLSTDIEVGYYSAAIKMKTILVSIVTSLGTVLLPRLTYYIKDNNKEEFIKISVKAMEYIFIVGGSFSIFFCIYAQETIIFLSGSEFLKATTPMIIITPTIFLIGLSNLIGMQILVPLGKEKIVLISEIAGAVIDIIINFFFIPEHGASGAAFGTTIAEAIVLLIQIYSIRKLVFKIGRNIQFRRILIPLFGSSVIGFLCKDFNCGNSFLQLAWTSALFFGTFGVGMFLAKENLFCTICKDIKSRFYIWKKEH